MHHLYLNVRAALTRWSNRELAGFFVDTRTGRALNAQEAKEHLAQHLAQCHEVIPLDMSCEGFDYAGGACPGHPMEEP